MAIVINGSGTVTGLAVGGLPDGTVDAGTLATDSVVAAKLGTDSVTTDALKSDAITGADLPAGSVLQVVTSTDSSEMTLASSSFTDTGMSVAITPISTSSKILCFWEVQCFFNTSGGTGIATQLYRGATGVSGDTYQNDIGKPNSTWGALRGHWTYLDSPSTTSATTYKVKVKGLNTDPIYVNHNGHKTTLTLMEIVG